MSQPTDAMREFHAQAYEELRMKNPDRGLWASALAESDGDQKKAVSYYIRERALVLQAHTTTTAPPPVNTWDRTQVPNLPATKRPPWLWIALLGLWLLAFLARRDLPAATDSNGLILALAGSLGHVLGALVLGAFPGLMALGIHEFIARISNAPPLPRLRVFGAVTLGFAYVAMLGIAIM